VKRRLAIVAAAALAWPAAACAHGPSAQVATNWAATIESEPDGVDARPVDGDRDLWLHVARPLVVEIVGVLDEPLLRFDPNGVWVNANSPTAASDGIQRGAGAAPAAAPRWERVGHGSSYRWHEHRLHALEAVGGGRWSVPLRVDGRHTEISGVLRKLRRGPTWAWLAVAVAAVGAGLFLRRGVRLATAAAIATAGALQVGYALHGRPTVDARGYTNFALTCALAAALLALLLSVSSPDAVGLTGLAVGALAASVGLFMTPVLIDAAALSALGTRAARVLVVLALGTGTAAAGAGFRLLVRPEAAAP
jgi:hypothetical protein